MFRSQITRDVAGCLMFAAVLTTVSWRTYSLLGVPGPEFDPQVTSMGDFREVIYYPARAALDGVNPYDNRLDDDPTRYRNRYPVYNVFPLYSPILFPFAAPFALLPYAVAQIVYWAVNVALVLLLAVVALKWAGIAPSVASTTSLAALILLSRPGHANLYYGQVTLPATLATAAALIYARTKPALAGIFLAIATFKPTFGGPAALLMFARGDRRAAVIGLLIGAAIAIGGWSAVFYRDAHRQNPVDVLLNNQTDTEDESGARVESTGNRIDAPLVFERLLGPALKPVWRFALPVGVVIAGAWSVWWLGRSPDALAPDARRLSDSLILTTTAICIYHNVYDALLLTLPLVWLGSLLWRSPISRYGRILPGIAFCAFLVPAFHYFSSHRFLELLARSANWEATPGSEFPDGIWTFVSVLNGASITTGWVVLITMSTMIGRVRVSSWDS